MVFFPLKLFYHLMPASGVLSLIRFIKIEGLLVWKRKKSWSFRYSEMGLINHRIDESLNPNSSLKTRRQSCLCHLSGHVFVRILAQYHAFSFTVLLVV